MSILSLQTQFSFRVGRETFIGQAPSVSKMVFWSNVFESIILEDTMSYVFTCTDFRYSSRQISQVVYFVNKLCMKLADENLCAYPMVWSEPFNLKTTQSHMKSFLLNLNVDNGIMFVPYDVAESYPSLMSLNTSSVPVRERTLIIY